MHGQGHQEEHVEITVHWARSLVLPTTAVVVVCCALQRGLHRWYPQFPLPASGTVLLIGSVLGASYTKLKGTMLDTEEWDELSAGASLVLNFGLLPILIFQAGWTLNVRDFFTQLWTILLFAVLGTLLAAAIIFLSLVWTAPASLGWRDRNEKELYAFAALISAVDPVATLATFAELRVERFLNIIVLGEALINDAVAVVLFDGFKTGQQLNFKTAFLEMAWQLCGSALLGIVGAIGLTLIFKIERFGHDDHEMATVYILLSTLSLFALASASGLSGIISTLCGSIIMGIYVRSYLLPAKVADYVDASLDALCHLADMFLFAVVGVGSALGLQMFDTHGGGAMFVKTLRVSLLTFVGCLLGRAVATYGLSGIRNALHFWRRRGWSATEQEEYKITWARAHVIWWGGGLRGAIALVCAMDLPNSENKPILVNATMLNIFLTVLLFGGTTEKLIKYLGIPLQTPKPVVPAENGGGERRASLDMFAAEVPQYQQAALQRLHTTLLNVVLPEDGDESPGPRERPQEIREAAAEAAEGSRQSQASVASSEVEMKNLDESPGRGKAKRESTGVDGSMASRAHETTRPENPRVNQMLF